MRFQGTEEFQGRLVIVANRFAQLVDHLVTRHGFQIVRAKVAESDIDAVVEFGFDGTEQATNTFFLGFQWGRWNRWGRSQ